MAALTSGRRFRVLSVSTVLAFVIMGCTGEEKTAPPPNITVNPPAAPPKPGAPTNAGPGSDASTDSTLRH